MADAILWGLVQGLTEFLPISSSGHLILVPEFLGKEEPGVAITAVLHLGTLAAVLVYYRSDLLKLWHGRREAQSRRIVMLLVIGTIPAAIAGFLLEDSFDELFNSASRVGIALIITGFVLLGSGFIVRRSREFVDAKVPDAIGVGIAQAAALVPGISRSGMTITASLARGFSDIEAARFSFLLAIPAIAGAGFLQGLELLQEGGLESATLVGMLVAAVSGYIAIAFLLRVLIRYGLQPFAWYCFIVGAIAVIAF